MKENNSNRLIISSVLCFILCLFIFSSAWSYEDTKKITGFFVSVKSGNILILDSKIQNIQSFKLSDSVKVTYKGKTVSIDNILIHSIVELTISNNVVTEIAIKEVSS